MALLITAVVFAGYSNRSNSDISRDDSSANEKLTTFTDKTFGFSADFPEKWEHSISSSAVATNEIEATPDSGIEIYVNENKENRIYVFRQHGHISMPDPDDYEAEDITTLSGLKGEPSHLANRFLSMNSTKNITAAISTIVAPVAVFR